METPVNPPQRPRYRFWLTLGASVAAIWICGLGILYVSILQTPAESSDTFLANCREICQKYGLIPTGHVANDAKRYLHVVGVESLNQALVDILADETFEVLDSQPHPLLGKSAPGFRLKDDSGTPRGLEELAQGRPIVLVYYYGYGCSHCVAQLFSLDQELDYFHQLGAEVIAFSGDTPEHTAAKYAEYGRFHFPVLSDSDYKVAEAYGVHTPARDGKMENTEHGTFVINRDGQVIWAYRGPQPFLDNKTLLFVLAESQQLQTARSAKRAKAVGVTPGNER